MRSISAPASHSHARSSKRALLPVRPASMTKTLWAVLIGSGCSHVQPDSRAKSTAALSAPARTCIAAAHGATLAGMRWLPLSFSLFAACGGGAHPGDRDAAAIDAAIGIDAGANDSGPI